MTGHINNVDVDVLKEDLWYCALGSLNPSLLYDTFIFLLYDTFNC